MNFLVDDLSAGFKRSERQTRAQAFDALGAVRFECSQSDRTAIDADGNLPAQTFVERSMTDEPSG